MDRAAANPWAVRKSGDAALIWSFCASVRQLIGDDAPTRAILCAGAGHFARAHVTLTPGAHVGDGDDAAEQVRARWNEIGDRAGDAVPEAGTAQVQAELAAATRAR